MLMIMTIFDRESSCKCYKIYTVICGYVVENIFQFDRNACMGSHHRNTYHSDPTEKMAFGEMQMPSAPHAYRQDPPQISMHQPLFNPKTYKCMLRHPLPQLPVSPALKHRDIS